MANEQNLRPSEYKLTQEEQKKGGIKSGEVRRAKRDLRKALETLLENAVSVKDKATGNTITMTGTDAISTKLFEQAMKGNVKAFETLRDTVGQKPIDKVMISEVDVNVVEEVESAVLDE